MTDDLWHPIGTIDEAAIPPRNYRGDRPIRIDTPAVPVNGESLDPVWWRGKQWAVTTYGIEALDGTYQIAKDELVEHIETGSWMMHMGAKVWCDSEEFATAWLVAIAMHGVQVSGDAVRQAVAGGVMSR